MGSKTALTCWLSVLGVSVKGGVSSRADYLSVSCLIYHVVLTVTSVCVLRRWRQKLGAQLEERGKTLPDHSPALPGHKDLGLVVSASVKILQRTT